MGMVTHPLEKWNPVVVGEQGSILNMVMVEGDRYLATGASIGDASEICHIFVSACLFHLFFFVCLNTVVRLPGILSDLRRL